MKKNTKLILLALSASLLLAACGSKAPETAAPGSTASAEAAAAETAEKEAAEKEPETKVSGKDAESEASETAGKNIEKIESDTEGAAEQGEKDSDKSDASAKASAEVTPIAFEMNDYERQYPGIRGMDNTFISSATLFTVTTPGFEKLQASLDELGEVWKAQADHAFSEQAKEFASGEFNEYMMELTPFSDIRFADVVRADSNVFSFTTTDATWYGGAHPNSYQSGFSIDPKTGKRLELTDAVTDYDAFYEEVHKALLEQEKEYGFFDEWEETLHDTFYGSEYKPTWVIAKDGIDLWFNTYALAPYASGPVFLEFPKEKYSELLNAEYFPDNVPEVQENSSSNPYNTAFNVYDLCSEKGTLEDDAYGEVRYSFCIPTIYAENETADIKDINEELADLKKTQIDPQLELVEAGEVPAFYTAGYTTVRWNGITSICLSIDTPSDTKDWYIWNLNEKGEKVEDSELLKLFNMTEKQFAEAAREQLSYRVDWAMYDLPEDMTAELEKLKEDTLSDDNIKSSPLFITPQHGLGFIGGIYTPAGAGYFQESFVLPATEQRTDGLTEITINPQSEDNIVLKGDHYELKDNGEGSGAVYRFDADTVLIEGLPVYDDGCDSMTWMARYLANPAYAETAADEAYAHGGFAPGDMMTILVDENDHISVMQEIGYWD